MSDAIEIDTARARALVAEGAQLVDVREDHEVQAGRLGGSRHVAMADLQGAAGSLDRATPIVFYCRVGGRSGMAADAFRQAGFEAYSLRGGILEWDRQGLPLEPEDGTVADH